MACGKTTVGPALAARLDRRFVDLDHLIVAKVGCTIGELITCEGEQRFRQLETETLLETAQKQMLVIAPGGGAITLQENRQTMSRFGVSIWLDAPFELCWQRIRRDAIVRPLAATEEAARERYEQRLPLYQQAAIRVAIHESQTPDEIATTIISRLSEQLPQQ